MNAEFRHTWQEDQKKSGVLYKCRGYEKCSHFSRIRKINGMSWSLQESVSHSHLPGSYIKQTFGIDNKFINEVDRQLRNGSTPLTTINILKDLCTHKTL